MSSIQNSSLVSIFAAVALHAQLLNTADLRKLPTDTWPTYNGDYTGQRHSPLKQVNLTNVKSLGLAWIHRVELGQMSRAQQADEGHRIKATPLLVKGVLYFTTISMMLPTPMAPARMVQMATTQLNAFIPANRP